jgi:ketosteroid isomerase-like protein
MSTDQEQILRVGTYVIERFAAHDVAGYFACFAPEATFIFHNESTFMSSRAAYEAVWQRWEREDGFRVLECRSFDQRAKVMGDVGIFTHQLVTRLGTNSGEQESAERETIIFQRQPGGEWLAVHEHLSPYNFK